MKTPKLDESCMECGSKNTKMYYEGLETDWYKCNDCKKDFGITDHRRIAGFSKREVQEMDKENVAPKPKTAK
ncbi:hypothetical protein J4206_03385 [Candidatus Woesearchaeota archaeon]|nr:hypothetical protein [Candidatus Woesearchaeota archaeon]